MKNAILNFQGLEVNVFTLTTEMKSTKHLKFLNNSEYVDELKVTKIGKLHPQNVAR